MTLRAFLDALKTSGVKITLLDAAGTEIIKFFSEGYEGVESDILGRTIRKFEITSNTAISVTINDAVVSTDDTTNNG